VNCRDLDGRHSTPLHFAAGYNRKTVVEFLLKHGADVHAKDKGYMTCDVFLCAVVEQFFQLVSFSVFNTEILN